MVTDDGTISGTFTGNTKDWSAAYTNIVATADAHGWAWIIKMGKQLFNLAGHGSIKDADITDDQAESHFNKGYSAWRQEMSVMKQEICKKHIDTRSGVYTQLEDTEKKELREYIIFREFCNAQKKALRSLKAFLTSTTAKKGARGSELTAILSTPTVREIIDGDFTRIRKDDITQVWHTPAVTKFADILELLEGKGRSGAGSFWSSMQESIRSVNPMKKGTPATFTDADTELKETWQILAKQYKDDVEGLVRRLQAEQRMHMFHLLSMQKNDQSEAWVDAYKKCVEDQRLRSGGLTLQMTQDAADTALAQIAAHTTKSKGTTQQSNLNKEVTALVTSLLDKRPQDQKGAAGGDRKKRKPTSGKKSTCGC